MKVANRRWPFIAVGAGFLLVGFLHLIAWVFMVFIYHASAEASVVRTYLSVYGLLGTPGVWLFLLTILLDLVAGLFLLGSRSRGRTVVFLTAILNLAIIPLGSIVGAAALFILFGLPHGRL